MAHAVEPSRSAHVTVEVVVDSPGAHDVRRSRPSPRTPRPWVPGRVTLTRTHLDCIASRSGPGEASFSISLLDVEGVALSCGLGPRTVTVRTADRVVQLRMSGAAGFARRVGAAREAARHRAAAR